jgi:HEPN domain-containing protein
MQQAAEKALKAVLVFEQIAFPYTHNLTTLSNPIPDEWSVAQAEADLERLSEYAVESRYPGDLPEITSTEAEEATADARRLFDAAEHDVNTRLPDDSSSDE